MAAKKESNRTTQMATGISSAFGSHLKHRHYERQIPPISGPVSHKTELSTWGAARAKKRYRFFTVMVDFAAPGSAVPGPAPQMSAHQGEVVQLIESPSQSNAEWAYVKSLSRISEGYVPHNILQADFSITPSPSRVNDDSPLSPVSCSPASRAHSKFSGSLMAEYTPPNSPTITISSRGFKERSLSVNSSYLTRSQKYSRFQSLKNVAKLYVQSINYDADGRIQYKIHVITTDGSSMEIYKHYQDFYQLQLALLSEVENISTNKSNQQILSALMPRLPGLPAPVPVTNDHHISQSMQGRIEIFNVYLSNLLNQFGESTHEALGSILLNWLINNEVSPRYTQSSRGALKILFKGDYYNLRYQYGQLDTLCKLLDLIGRRIKELPQKENVTLTAKIDGWYILEIADEHTYQGLLSKMHEYKKLVIEIC